MTFGTLSLRLRRKRQLGRVNKSKSRSIKSTKAELQWFVRFPRREGGGEARRERGAAGG